ncbi:alpha/beta fold hydrolase [Mucilaginibacter sp.]|jgi:pimeloyl-ACP methyl ester carboxylesterase|uniref:alpha/beta fold hydrolase n=1 Tax=Mucilaginibacter sp. TaxID=1882438 RepID=UPI003561DC19
MKLKKKLNVRVVIVLLLVLFDTHFLSASSAKTLPAAQAITVRTQFVNVKGVKFAYRRYGKKQGLPLVFIQHLAGTMDNWDPAVLDGFAKDREVIIFDNAGISSSEGRVPDNIADMANDAESFINALGIKKIDLLGFSIGGMVAQQLTLDHPELIRRLVLVGTGPRGGEGMAVYKTSTLAMFDKKYAHPDEIFLETLFDPSPTSQAAGRAFLERIRARKIKEPAVSDEVAKNQIHAIYAWGAPAENSFAYLKEIKQPVLVVSGHTDVILPSVNSFILQQNLPNAFLIVYPDSNHGPHDRFPNLFVKQVSMFLDGVK